MSRPSGFTPAQRAYLRSLLKREREETLVGVQRILNDVLGEEAALVAFQVMTAKHEPPPSA